METATEQLCPPNFRAFNAPKCLTWIVELRARNKNHKYSSSDIEEVSGLSENQKGIVRRNPKRKPEFARIL